MSFRKRVLSGHFHGLLSCWDNLCLIAKSAVGHLFPSEVHLHTPLVHLPHRLQGLFSQLLTKHQELPWTECKEPPRRIIHPPRPVHVS